MSNGGPKTVAEIASAVNGTMFGDATRLISRAATLDQATSDCASWAGSTDAMKQAISSDAGVILIPLQCSLPEGKTVIQVSDPDLAFCTVLEMLGESADAVPAGVHESAHVAANATVDAACIGPNVIIGERSRIGAGSQLHAGVVIGSDVEIGTNCVIWPNVVIRERSVIGDRVIVHPNTTIGADGFGYLQRDGKNIKIPQIGRVVIEEDVEIGAGSAIDRARSGDTCIGRGTKIDNLVQIGHNTYIGEHCVIVGCCAIAGSVVMGHHVLLSGQVGVVDHVHIGDGAQIAAKSLITADVPAGAVFRGIPAVDHTQFSREAVSIRKLPGLLKKLNRLVRRMEE